MSYIKEIVKNMENATFFIGKKTKDGIDNIKLKKQFHNESKKLSKLYEELGKISYNIHVGKRNQINEIDNICNQIKKQIKIVNKLKNKSNYLKETDNKDIENNDIAAYDLEETTIDNTVVDEPVPEPELGKDGYLLLKFCSNCQTGNNPEAKKCISCGQLF
jgi:hypothetical protein